MSQGLHIDAALGKDGKSALLTRCPRLGPQLHMAMRGIGFPWKTEVAYMGVAMRMDRRSPRASTARARDTTFKA